VLVCVCVCVYVSTCMCVLIYVRVSMCVCVDVRAHIQLADFLLGPRGSVVTLQFKKAGAFLHNTEPQISNSRP